MKKILCLATLLIALLPAWSATVDQRSAQHMAQQFMQRHTLAGHMHTGMAGAIKLSHTEFLSHQGSAPAYYIFNAGNTFIIVAGDDRAREILAYGDQPLDMAHLPANMQYWLTQYKQQIEYLHAHPALQPSMQSPLRASTTVTPLLSANWSQNAPYWNECPVFGTDTCYTGCPATSLSMVFHYWKYPKQQTPAVSSYMLPSYGTFLPELVPTTFDWDNMLDNYIAGQYNDVQASAVAHLMRYIGQAEEMDYTISGSGALGNDILRAVKFFEYDQNAQLVYKTDDLGYANYTDAQWGSMIETELAAGRPIVYCAYDNLTGSGHAFNLDGVDSDGNYHINWGWNGRGNGYFALNAFSYNDYTFGTGQQMIIGIQPPEGYQDPRLQAYPTTVMMQAYIGKPSTTSITLKGTNLTGDVALSLNDPDGAFAIDATSLSQLIAEGGTEVTVTYSPQAVGTNTATLTCTSAGANTLTITLNGNAPLEVYQPVMQPARESDITLTSFRADWSDETPSQNVASYTLEVMAKPSYSLIEDADFSDLPQEAVNQASNASQYLPAGWTFTGSELNLEGGCICPRRNSTITTGTLDLTGYDKVTVEVLMRSYGYYGDPSELYVSTSMDKDTIVSDFTYRTWTVVLDCAEQDHITFKAGYYPMIREIKIYAGDATQAASVHASESGDNAYRLIEGITPDKFYTVSDLAAGGTYFYKVKAAYIDGSESEWSNSEMVVLHENAHPFQRGDVNHDGSVNIGDVTVLIDLLLGNGEDACVTCADVDGDSNVNIGDVTNLIDVLLSR
jgi:hypothetical protein